MKYPTLTGKNAPAAPSEDRILIRRGTMRSDDLWWAGVLGRWVPAFEVHIGNGAIAIWRREHDDVGSLLTTTSVEMASGHGSFCRNACFALLRAAGVEVAV